MTPGLYSRYTGIYFVFWFDVGAPAFVHPMAYIYMLSTNSFLMLLKLHAVTSQTAP